MFRSGARSVARAIAARCAVAPGAASATASDALAAASRASRAAVPGEGSGASRRSAGLGASFDRGFARASAPARGHGHGHGAADADAETITVTFNEKDGSETVVQVRRDAAAPRGGATQIPRFSGADLPRVSPPPLSPPLSPSPPNPFISQAPIGQSMLEVAHRNDIELEGACEGSLACSTCHVIIDDQATYDALPEPDDDENDMLDLAFGLTETSRLGCQVIAAKELDGMSLSLPKATRNFAVDGFVPKPH